MKDSKKAIIKRITKLLKNVDAETLAEIERIITAWIWHKRA